MLAPAHSRIVSRRTLAVLGMTAAVGLLVAACGSSTDSGGMTGTEGMSSVNAAPHQDGMPGMDDMPTGDGLAADASGFRFVPVISSLPAAQPADFRFRIAGADGKPVTTFEDDQTKLMHFYLIRS